jgi:hypothetical protein
MSWPRPRLSDATDLSPAERAGDAFRRKWNDYRDVEIAALNRTIELALLECERLRCRLRSNKRRELVDNLGFDIVEHWSTHYRDRLFRKLWIVYHRYSEPLPAWLWEGLA